MLNFTYFKPTIIICSNTIKLDEKLGAGEDMEFCKQIKVFFLCTDHCTPVQYCAANTFKKIFGGIINRMICFDFQRLLRNAYEGL